MGNCGQYLLILLALLGTGCAAVNSVERAQPRANPNYIADKRIEPDVSLSKSAQIVRVQETTVGNGLLKIQVELYNTRKRRCDIQYRFEWIDESGFLIDSVMTRWTPLSIAAQESILISGVAPTPRAVDFRLKLIEPN